MLKKPITANSIAHYKQLGYYTLQDVCGVYVYNKQNNFVAWGTTEARAWYDLIYKPSTRYTNRYRLVAV